MNHYETFPLQQAVLNLFRELKIDPQDIMLVTVDYNGRFGSETDASDYCIVAT